MKVLIVLGAVIFLTSLNQFLTRKFIDQEKVKKLRKEIRKTKDQKEQLEKQIELMKEVYKSFFITVPSLILVIYLLRVFVKGTVIALPFSLPILGNELDYLESFIIFSFLILI